MITLTEVSHTGSLKLELQVAVTYLIWVLNTKLRSSAKAVCARS